MSMDLRYVPPTGLLPYTDDDRRRRVADEVRKHMGPGNHPSGTPQSEHGRGGTGFVNEEMHGSALLQPHQGERTRTENKVKRKVTTYLINPDGSAPRVGTAGIESLHEMVVDPEAGGEGAPHAPAENADSIVDKLRSKMKSFGWSEEQFNQNLDRLWASAQARYADYPELVEADMFYQKWHDDLAAVAAESDIAFGQVVAASSVISPGYEATQNLQAVKEIAAYVHENREYTGDELVALKDHRGKPTGETITIQESLRLNAELLRNPVMSEKSQQVLRRETNPETGELFKPGDPTGKKPDAPALEAAAALDAAADAFDNGPVRLLDMHGQVASRLIHYQRQVDQGAGFQVKNYTFFGNAVDVLRGYTITADGTRLPVDADDVLSGIKTRSFYNNILDPNNEMGRGDVTIDYHGVNFAAFVTGADANSGTLNGGIGGVDLGVRPFVADGIYRIAEREGLAPSRVQEILWAEWKGRPGHQGGLGDPRSDAADTWTSYTGEVYQLPYIGTGRKAKK